MAKVTEQDVIVFLKERVVKLQAELQKTQAALDAFSGTEQPAAPSPVAEEEVVMPKAARRGRRPASRKEVQKSLEAPAEFLASDKLENKIAYVLSDRGPSFNSDIIDRLKELEPEKDAEKLGRSIMAKLGALQRAGRIKGNREGRRVRYAL
ncbi:hypothetical protein [Arcticibacter sp. MXS-1]|uniref:hypothetical protein n=1 Tax=Arcticibacter sp. MXS-1 TaxID=3341726 RepID=UPI0035A9266E